MIKLPVIRDTSVSSVKGEQTTNKGKSPRLKLKSIQECVLFDVDVTKFKGLLVKEAWLHFKSGSPNDAPVKRAGISTVASEWREGKSRGFFPETGSACFVQAQYKVRNWAYPGSTLMDVVFGRGHTIWRSVDATPPDREGWQKCRISPEILAMRIAGISKGFCLYDDVGSKWEEKEGRFSYNYFPNRMIYSKENYGGAPWLEVEVKGTDKVSPEPVDSIRVETDRLPAGEALLSWKTPSDKGGGETVGFDVKWKNRDRRGIIPRYLVPAAKSPGREVLMHIQDMDFRPNEAIELSVVSVDSAGNRSKPFRKTVAVSNGNEDIHIPKIDLNAFSQSDALPSVNGVRVWITDLLDKYIPEIDLHVPRHDKGYRTANHIFSAEKKLVRLNSAKNEDVCFQVNIRGDTDNVSVDCLFENDPEIVSKVYRFQNVRGKASLARDLMIPDPLIPGKSFQNNYNKKGGSFLCEIYVSPNTRQGRKKGTLVVRKGNSQLEFDIVLTVWGFSLPDRLSFVPEMNAYSRVSPYKGYEYYRLAHRHRTCLNRLPYGWSGSPEFAPLATGTGFDWKEWDRRVGPILEGSAFTDLPRKGQPVDVFYLPFNENWPVPLSGNYTKSFWPDKALSDRYKKGLKDYFRAFALHAREKGWNQTQFQFYLNNKVYYRKKAASSSAPWIFDEPVNIQDFTALRWYGNLWHKAVDPVKGDMDAVFRCDVSYTQFGRDLLWEVCDIEYIGGNTFQKTRMKHDEFILSQKGQFAEYGVANRISEPNLQPVLWQLAAWQRGAKNVLPWQTIGSDKCWKEGEQTALFYPKGERVYPSVRLKAFRHGQQLIEYLVKLGEVLDVPEDAVRLWLGKRYGQKQWETGPYMLDYPYPGEDQVSITDLWRLRVELGKAIHAKLKSNKG